MIEAAQTADLVPAVDQRCTAVRAELLDETDDARGIAKGHQLLSEDADAHGRTARLGDLFRQGGWNPIATEKTSQGHVRADLRQEIVVFRAKHRATSCRTNSCTIQLFSRNLQPFAHTRSASTLHRFACNTQPFLR